MVGLNHHTYANDNQIDWQMDGKQPADAEPDDVEFMWYTTPRRVHLIDRSAFHFKDGNVEISSVLRYLGAFFDESMSMSDNVSS